MSGWAECPFASRNVYFVLLRPLCKSKKDPEKKMITFSELGAPKSWVAFSYEHFSD
jgi:hypothetical protein